VAITVRPGEKPGEYELVDGRRRLLAMQEAGIKEAITTIVESSDSTDAYAKSFVANIHRLSHDPVEISNVFATLSETLKNKEIAKMCGMSEGFVSQHLTIRKLPPKFLSALKKGTLLMAEGRELCRLDPEEDAAKIDEIGTKMIEGSLDAFLGAEKISEYLAKKDEKAAGKEGKAKKKGKKDGEAKSLGRPVKVKDYADVKDQIKMCNKTEGFAKLEKWSTKLAATKSDANRRYIKGRLEGIEEACGLRDAD
jgi:ParB/RepB/Spo0J family partition protein